MPNRIIKESICYSDDIDKLTPFEETVFYRLIVRADDFGRLDARPNFLKNTLFVTKTGVTEKSISDAILKLSTIGLVQLYEVDEKPFLTLTKWDRHQTVRNQTAKYPAPPNNFGAKEHSVPSEHDVEMLLFNHIESRGELFGHRIITSDRQVCIEKNYVDIIAKAPSLTLILELKRGRLSNKAINQIERYMNLMDGYGVLIGCGMARNFNLEKCKKKNIAVITYDNALKFTLAQKSTVVKLCNFSLDNGSDS